MEKKSKVVSIVKEEWAKPDKYGNLIHTVTFENGDTGWYKGKDEGAKYFEVGKEVEYDLSMTPKKTGDGENVWIKKPERKEEPRQAGGPTQKTGAVLSHDDLKFRAKLDCVGFATSYVKDLIVHDKLTMEGMEKAVDRMVEIMHKQIDNV